MSIMRHSMTIIRLIWIGLGWWKIKIGREGTRRGIMGGGVRIEVMGGRELGDMRMVLALWDLNNK